jgi:uncharacterized protein
MALSGQLLEIVRKQFVLEWDGIHGARHWARVRENGLLIAESNGANKEIVELFAFLHDVKRADNGRDPEHGKRVADFIKASRPQLLQLSDADFDLLTYACMYHSDGLIEADITVQTCWDSDRLDLGRIGIKPEPRFLCTEAARETETILWAWRRSRAPVT